MIDSYGEFLRLYAIKMRDMRFDKFMKFCCDEYKRDIEYGECEPPKDY